MGNINLYEKTRKNNQGGGFLRHSKSVVIAIILLAITAGGYAAAHWWSADYTARIDSTKNEIQAQRRGENNRETVSAVHDMHVRLENMRNHGTREGAIRGMEFVEKNILKGVVLAEYAYLQEGGTQTVDLTGDAENLNVLGQQLAQFRSIEGLKGVGLDSMGISETGFILFNITLTIM